MLQELESFATYDPAKGGFTVTRQRSRKYPAGSALGSPAAKKRYYKNVELSKPVVQVYNLHWLVWLWHTGHWPKYQLDHLNQDKHDNRIENLRDAHRSFNSKNARLPSDNTSGHIGVSYVAVSGKWRSYACHRGKTHFFGTYDTKEEAIAARLAALTEHPEWGFTPKHGSSNPGE